MGRWSVRRDRSRRDGCDTGTTGGSDGCDSDRHGRGRRHGGPQDLGAGHRAQSHLDGSGGWSGGHGRRSIARLLARAARFRGRTGEERGARSVARSRPGLRRRIGPSAGNRPRRCSVSNLLHRLPAPGLGGRARGRGGRPPASVGRGLQRRGVVSQNGVPERHRRVHGPGGRSVALRGPADDGRPCGDGGQPAPSGIRSAGIDGDLGLGTMRAGRRAAGDVRVATPAHRAGPARSNPGPRCTGRLERATGERRGGRGDGGADRDRHRGHRWRRRLCHRHRARRAGLRLVDHLGSGPTRPGSVRARPATGPDTPADLATEDHRILRPGVAVQPGSG